MTIGTSPPRPDGWGKVTGASRYGDDLPVAGLWHGATVRSPHPRARIRSLRFDADAAPEGAVCVTAADLPGPNGIQLIDDSWPILADGEVHHVGEPVALVAAATPLDALRAAAAVEVDYEPLPAVLSLTEAARHPPLCSLALGADAGEVAAALAAADRVVEGTWRTGYQEHVYIECQVMTAWEDGEELVVHGSMQCLYYVHKSLVHAFGLSAERVRVLGSTVGGGFGGKEDYPSVIAVHAALLARAAGRPVRLAYDRHEDIVGTTKRHPSVVRVRTGVKADGTLEALDVDVTLDGGAYLTLSSVVLSRALLHAAGPYRCPAVRLSGRVLRTNTATNGAFRGFGVPQTAFAAERQMDLVARTLGLDPLTLRRRNVVRAGDALPTGQVLDESTAAAECLERAAERTGFAARWRQLEEERRRSAGSASGAPRRGLGLSLYFHGAGFTGSGERRMASPVTARLAADGGVEVLTAMADMGQGSAAVFPQLAAAALGLPEADVRFAPPDTAIVPDSGPTVASRTTMIVGGTITRVLGEIRRRVVEWWRAEHGGDGEQGDELTGEALREAFRRRAATGEPLEVTLEHRPPAWQEFDDETYRGAAYPTYAWGCDVVEVEVDPDTLAVTPVEITAVCEVGRAIHPRLCAGQIEGGTLQAMGWALMEEIKVEDGRYLNDRLATYIIPTIRDTPPIHVELLEKPWRDGPFGAKGIGELPMDGAAPAVAAAVEQASGVVVDEIPATPERLHAGRPLPDPAEAAALRHEVLEEHEPGAAASEEGAA